MSGRGRLLTVAGSLAALLAAGALAFAASQPLIGALVLVGTSAVMMGAIAAHRAGGAARAEAAGVGEAMASVADGDFNARPGLLSSEPLSALQAPFDAMAGSIAALFSQLSDQRSQLEAVLDTMADGVVVVDGDDRLSLANPAAQDLLAIGSVSGQRLSTAFRDYELQGLVTVCRQQHAQQRAELHLPSVRRTVSATATPLIPSPRAPEAAVLLTLHDLTILRQLETTRREFVANVSHELRSPLASVKAMVETLEGGAVNDEAVAADFLQRAHREVDRMSAIVDDLLELSRIESGQSELRREIVSLAAIAMGVRSTLEPRSSSSGIEVEVSADADWPVLGDEGKLRQVVSNLVDNALKFTPQGGRIEISIGANETGDAVRVEVRDNGDGISPEHLPHLFERFYKADRSRHGKGTGLGLAIVKHIVESHGGEIGVESELGAGSTVWFTLPAGHAS